jgi:hypothetical protein
MAAQVDLFDRVEPADAVVISSGTKNAVSERLFSLAMCCMTPSSSPGVQGTHRRGIAPEDLCRNASTWKMGMSIPPLILYMPEHRPADAAGNAAGPGNISLLGIVHGSAWPCNGKVPSPSLCLGCLLCQQGTEREPEFPNGKKSFRSCGTGGCDDVSL